MGRYSISQPWNSATDSRASSAVFAGEELHAVRLTSQDHVGAIAIQPPGERSELFSARSRVRLTGTRSDIRQELPDIPYCAFKTKSRFPKGDTANQSIFATPTGLQAGTSRLGSVVPSLFDPGNITIELRIGCVDSSLHTCGRLHKLSPTKSRVPKARSG